MCNNWIRFQLWKWISFALLVTLEDKLLQTAGSDLLSAIYEQDFHDFSYGYRPKRGARQCADDLNVRMQFGRFGYVVEADIKGLSLIHI